MKLLVYFSYTGHTKYIAEIIKQNINCDVIRLEPVISYSNDYNKVVNDEQNQESSDIIPEIKDINIDLDLYDTIIIGTPVWWYRSAPVIRAFLKKYDLSNKIIIPYATNAGWLGKTFNEIKSLCSNSKVVNEFNIVFTSNYNKNELVTPIETIENWINNI